MNDTVEASSSEQSSQLPEHTVLAFARELRRLAAQVERDLRRNAPVSALSALTAIKPLTGALSDAALSEVMCAETETTAIDSSDAVTTINHNGYL
jgi:hypothetical protein